MALTLFAFMCCSEWQNASKWISFRKINQPGETQWQNEMHITFEIYRQRQKAKLVGWLVEQKKCKMVHQAKITVVSNLIR